jgi:hypothetical protein
VTSPKGGPTGLESLLAGEHAAIYGYGTAGPVLIGLAASAGLVGAVRSGYDALRESRDQLTEAITAAGGNPPATLPAYALPFPLNNAPAAVRFLAGLEDRLCMAAATAVGAAPLPAHRLLAADVLAASAVRAARLRLLGGAAPTAAVTPLPGLPGR